MRLNYSASPPHLSVGGKVYWALNKVQGNRMKNDLQEVGRLKQRSVQSTRLEHTFELESSVSDLHYQFC